MTDQPYRRNPETPFRHDSAVEGCVFCDVDRLPPFEEWTGPDDCGIFRVFTPLDPVVPGHLLVAPAFHTPDATEHPDVTGDAMHVAARVARRYPSANIITSIGPPATQTVFHLHVHVVPRTEDDGLTLPWTNQHRTDADLLIEGATRPHLDTEGVEVPSGAVSPETRERITRPTLGRAQNLGHTGRPRR